MPERPSPSRVEERLPPAEAKSATQSGRAMRDANRTGRPRLGRRHGTGFAGLGCLIVVLCGCVPAVVMTSTYIEKKEQPGAPADMPSPSSDQSQTDQRPLLTTKNYKDPVAGVPESVQIYRATFDQVWMAVLKALGRLEASVTSSTREQASGEIEGRSVGGQPFRLRLDRSDAHSMRVKIRVGQFGDRKAEDSIQAAIRENL